MQVCLRSSWILGLVQDALRDQIFGTRSLLDFLLQGISEHLFLELSSIGQQCGGGIETG